METCRLSTHFLGQILKFPLMITRKEKIGLEITGLVHKIEIGRGTVAEGVGIVLILPDGGDGGMAALCYQAPQRPRVD